MILQLCETLRVCTLEHFCAALFLALVEVRRNPFRAPVHKRVGDSNSSTT